MMNGYKHKFFPSETLHLANPRMLEEKGFRRASHPNSENVIQNVSNRSETKN